MKYDIYMSYTVKVASDGTSEEGKTTETTTQNRIKKIEQKDLSAKITEAISSIPEVVENFYLEVHKNWEDDLESKISEY